MDNENKVPEQSDEVISQPKAGFASKASNFAQSMISKGLKGNKADLAVTDLRNMSCNGDPARKLPPCSERQDSVNFPGSFFCGACGCGDKEMTLLKPRQLKNGENSYYKLEFPKVHCPLRMPGFTNYTPSENGVSENPRKKFVELTFGLEYTTDNSK